MTMNVDVTVIARKVAGKIVFEMEEKNQYTEMLVFNKTKDGIKKSDYYVIKFTLDDKTADDLVFDLENPMYISRGSDKHVPKCPKTGNVGSNQDFTITGKTNNILTVRNDDLDDCFYKFALNFTDSSGNPHIFDPIYGNQDGGTKSIITSAEMIGLISGATAGAASMILSASATAPSVLTGAAIGAIAGVIAAFILKGLGGQSHKSTSPA